MADTDSYEHLYDLPETISAISTDILPIEQSDGTKKITKANLLTGLVTSDELRTESATRYNADLLLTNNFASGYSPSAKYAVGAYCTYQNVLYKCKTTITTPESWNSAHWTAAKVMDEIAYPVGAIYLSVNSTSPASIFGGTWERIKDRFLLAAGDTYAAGSTGGEASHKLSWTEMPIHSHDLNALGDHNVVAWGDASDNTKSFDLGSIAKDYGGSKNRLATIPAGNDQPHNNMPPYLAIYMWKRIA
jgi:hypothetical protein